MKLRMLIILSLYLLSMFAITALSVDWMNPQGKSADELISGETSPQGMPNQAPNPQKSREIWSNRTGVNFTMPESLSAGGKSAKESRAAAEAASSQQTENSADIEAPPAEETPAAQSSSAAESDASPSGAATVGGSWSFTLDESTPKDMVLTLFQSGDTVFGTGSINTGDNPLMAAASGSVDGNNMNLDVTTIGTISLYKIALNLDGDSASGSYDAFATSGETWKGKAQGERTVSQ
jgi:hypothetical protein